MNMREKTPSKDLLDLLSKLCVVDVDIRIDVNKAINHKYISHYFGAEQLKPEKTCPFKVGCAIIYLYLLFHTSFSVHSGGSDGAKNSTECSSGSEGSEETRSEDERFSPIITPL
uniref:Protein kinase domain-containing protein n=1 Tax=Heterorhabditis bacteriophora TaxID=37862 RepID=A0A1I7WGM3_HETBA